MSAAVNLSFCAEHFKGGDGLNRQSGEEHWRWLEEAVYLYERLCDWPIFCSITGFPGFEAVENAVGNHERDVLWRIFDRPRVRLVTMAANPGHQVGAAWCIRLGLEAAAKTGIDYLLHTAEDVVPSPTFVTEAMRFLEQGARYVGEEWGEERNQLNSQFFACRTHALCGTFDPCQVGGIGCLEAYLRQQVPQEDTVFFRGHYRTTHNYAEWQRWVKETR